MGVNQEEHPWGEGCLIRYCASRLIDFVSAVPATGICAEARAVSPVTISRNVRAAFDLVRQAVDFLRYHIDRTGDQMDRRQWSVGKRFDNDWTRGVGTAGKMN